MTTSASAPSGNSGARTSITPPGSTFTRLTIVIRRMLLQKTTNLSTGIFSRDGNRRNDRPERRIALVEHSFQEQARRRRRPLGGEAAAGFRGPAGDQGFEALAVQLPRSDLDEGSHD